jgi:hypothetical protein
MRVRLFSSGPSLGSAALSQPPSRPRWALAVLVALLLGGLAAPQPAAAQGRPAQCESGYALWANGQGRDEILVISGSKNSITGAAHSNADLRISGSNNRISGAVEYVTSFDDGGDSNSYPSPTQVAAAAPPVSYSIASYRPGGTAAAAAEAAGRYQLISGDLDVAEPTVLDGLYYVTGDTKLSASNIRGAFTIVAEGAIDVSGSSMQAAPFADGLLLLSNKREVGASVIKLAGSVNDFRGVIAGPGGTVELSGSSSSIGGLVLGDALKLSGSDLRISFDAASCPGAPGTPPADEPRPAEPPARIIISDDDIVRRVEVINRITFVTVQFTIRNSGGRARDTRLVIDLGQDDDDDDDRFELAEVRFVEGAGYVREREGRRIVIGVGEYNVVRRNSPVVVSVTYRLREGVRDDDSDGQISFAARGRLLFSDSDGSQAVILPVLLVPVPVLVVPASPAEVVRLSLDQIDTRFRGAWEGRGGLAIFGLPLTEARTMDNGTLIQIFERARLELRPGGPGEVQFGRLAAELGYGTLPSARLEEVDDDERRWYAPETGHVIGAPFRAIWGRPGGLLIFGLPISALGVGADGRETQCFERVCMQLFPELRGTPSEVQLRLLGVELIARGADEE